MRNGQGTLWVHEGKKKYIFINKEKKIIKQILKKKIKKRVYRRLAKR